MVDLNLTYGTVTDGGGTRTFGTPANVNDNDGITFSERGAFAAYAGTYTSYLKADLGVAFEVTTVVVNSSEGGAGVAAPWTLSHSADGSSWTNAPVSTGVVGSNTTLTLTTPTTARYWRLEHTRVLVGLTYVTWIRAYTWSINGTVGSVPEFSGTPLSGVPPLTVQFTDESTNSPAAWAWDFGDGGTATTQNPSHQYTLPGIYTVALTVDAAATRTRVGYVTVNAPGIVIGDPEDYVELPAADIVSWRIQQDGGSVGGRSAYTGSATIVLRNRANRYNPENEASDIIDHLRDGTRIWVGINADGTIAPDAAKTVHGLFAGRITEITALPAPGSEEGYPPLVELVCEDPLAWISRVPVQVDASRHRSHRELRVAILEAAGETSYDLADEPTTMPLSYADGLAGNLLEELNDANGTRHFARPLDNPDDWYEYVTVSRVATLGGVATDALNAGTDHVTSTSGWRNSADTVINQQKATVEPYYFTPYQTVVWETTDVPFTVAHRPEIWVQFDDYVDAPVVVMNLSAGSATAVIEAFGQTAKITLTGTATISKLEVQGSLAKRGIAESVLVDDAASQAIPRGVRAGSEISGDYVGIIESATGIAEHIVWRFADPKYSPELVVENWMPEQFQREPYETLAVTSTHVGVAARIFEILGLTHESNLAAAGAVHHVTTYRLMESRVQTATTWFTWDTSLWNSADLLAY